MNKLLLGLLMVTASFVAQATTASERIKDEVARVGEEKFTASDYRPGIIRHMVLFRYKDQVTAEQKTIVKKKFLELIKKSKRNRKSYIVSIETGSQNSGEGVDQEFEQAFLVTFKSEGDRNYYVGKGIVQGEGNFDPAHDEFKSFVGPLLHQPVDPSGVLVFDYKVEASKINKKLLNRKMPNKKS